MGRTRTLLSFTGRSSTHAIRKFTDLLRKISLRWPDNHKVLLLDSTNEHIASILLDGTSYGVLKTRMQELNLFAALASIIERNFWRGKRYLAYQDAYIRLARPNVIITAIDNNPYFYTLKNRFPNAKTAFIQCARRSAHGDVFNYLKPSAKNGVDLMLVHNKLIGLHYQKYISGASIDIGAVNNNAHPKQICKSKRPSKRAVFISQWRPCMAPERFRRYNRDQYVSQPEFHSPEESLLPALHQWVEEMGFELSIYSASKSGEGCPEHTYYQRLVGNSRFTFFSPESSAQGLDYLDTSAITIGCESTLLYESISRGNRGACFHCRGSFLGWKDFNFGWPGTLGDAGFFWTNLSDLKEFRNIVDRVLACDDRCWNEQVSFTREYILAFDSGNKKGIKAMKDLINTR